MTINYPTLAHQLREQKLVRCTLLASETVLIYDYLCTLDQEVAYVWSNPRSISSLLFFINRYVPFVDTFLSLRLRFSENTPDECLEQYSVVTWLIVLGTVFSEAILFLRTYAIWERRRLIFTILVVLFLTVLSAAIVFTYLEVKTLDYVRSWDGGCLLVHASSLINIAYILLVLSETAMAILTAIKAYHHYWESESGWVMQLHKDGLIFYAFLLPLSLANLVVPVFAPSIFANWLATPQRVFHSIICTRVLLLILRQRSAALVNHLPGVGDTSDFAAMFTSTFEEDETTASMQITTMDTQSSES